MKPAEQVSSGDHCCLPNPPAPAPQYWAFRPVSHLFNTVSILETDLFRRKLVKKTWKTRRATDTDTCNDTDIIEQRLAAFEELMIEVEHLADYQADGTARPFRFLDLCLLTARVLLTYYGKCLETGETTKFLEQMIIVKGFCHFSCL